MVDDLSEKVEGGIVVVIVATFLLLAVGILAGLNPPTYRDETFAAATLLLPNEIVDPAKNSWYDVGCANATSYECVDESPPSDGNATYEWCNGSDVVCAVQYYGFMNLPGSLTSLEDFTVTSLRDFVWVRRNATSGMLFAFWMAKNEFPLFPECTYADTTTSATLAFSNVSRAIPQPSCRGEAWTVTLVNKITVGISLGGPEDAVNWEASSIGIVVAYTYTGQVLTPASELALLGPVALVSVVLVFVVVWAWKFRRTG